MKDIAKLFGGILLVFIAVMLIRPVFIKKFSWFFDMTVQDTFSFIMLLLTLLMLIMMWVTIMENNKASLEQINTIKSATIEQIQAIKDATKEHINRIEDFEKKSNKALLSALILEYEENLRQVNYVLKEEKTCVDTKCGDIPLLVISNEAYQAVLDKGIITNEVLINKIVRVYTSFKLYQNYIDAAKQAASRNDYMIKASNLSMLIKIIKDNHAATVEALEELLKFKKDQYGE